MDTDSKKIQFKNVISETLFLSLIPIISYAIAAAYEVGYNTYFNIPLELISVSAFNIFSSIVASLSFLIIFIGIFQGLFLMFGKIDVAKHPVEEIVFFRLIPMYFLLLISLISFGFKQWKDVVPIIFICLIDTLVYLILPVFRKDKSISYVEQIKHENEQEKQKFKGSSNIVQNILNSYGIKYHNIGILVFLVYTLILSAYGFGKRTAIEQDSFFVSKTNPNIAYLRFYNDKIISAVYSVDDNTITSLMVESSPPDNGIQIIKRKIGVLKPLDPIR